MEAANIKSYAEHEKYVVLLMDELHIKEDLVYDKDSGTWLCLFRVCDLYADFYTCRCYSNSSDIDSHLMALEQQESIE